MNDELNIRNFSAEEDALRKQAILDNLRQLGGSRITEESGVAYHNGRQILLPEGMTLKTGAKLLTKQAQSMEEEHDFEKVFRYRPWDGAYALQETLKQVFGVSGQGQAQYDMFGNKYPPQFRTVEVGVGKEVRIPWGVVDFPLLEATMVTGVQMDPTYGALFKVTITAPKKWEPQIEGLFLATEMYLKTNSIYKGKAIVGVGKVTREGFENPSFLDVDGIKPENVAYARDVFERLDASVWGPIRTAALQRAAGENLNLKTLLYGPYGTGKSLAGGLTAKVAVQENWTFIQCKTGDDDLSMVLKTAELYAPAVVFIEDIDILIQSDKTKMAELLEQFDGVSSKDKEVMVLMTSNHVDTLSKGMTRAGRIDAAIEIGGLDKEGIERLISSTFTREMLDPSIDWEAVYEAMHDYEPAFIMGTFRLTKRVAITRANSLNFRLTTDDFRIAAETLRNQHDTHSNAEDRPAVDTLGQVLDVVVADAARKVLDNSRVDFHDEGRVIKVDDKSLI